MTSARENGFDALIDEYPVWWIDFLGEHNHAGGLEATRWLLERSQLAPGKRILDAGAFVGAAARLAVARTGCGAVATDVNGDFLRTGRAMDGGDAVLWVAAATQRLPFARESFDSVWCLDSALAPRELTRVARPGATLCLCTEIPTDGRGGVEAFIDEWGELGWELAAHRAWSLEALQDWRRAEAALVARRSLYEPRYGRRPYLAQLDLIANLVRTYERGEQGHGLLVFRRV